MQIERNIELDLEELNGLLATEHWDLPIERLHDSIHSTWGWVTAKDEVGKLVGFVRILSDGVFHAYIFHLIVHPQYRNLGIGTAIMKELLRFLGGHRLMPALVSVPGKVEFYEKFGFATEMNGATAMCIRGKRYWDGDY